MVVFETVEKEISFVACAGAAVSSVLIAERYTTTLNFGCGTAASIA